MSKILIDEAVVRQAQEPVAWQWLDTANFRKKIPQYAERDAWRPLYTTPPAPASKPLIGLTDEEFVELCSADMGTAALIRAVEAKLKEKNGG